MLARLVRLFRRLASDSSPAAAPAAPPGPPPTFAGDLALAHTSPSDWCQRRRESGSLYVSMKSESLATLRDVHADRTRATVAAAERILRH